MEMARVFKLAVPVRDSMLLPVQRVLYAPRIDGRTIVHGSDSEYWHRIRPGHDGRGQVYRSPGKGRSRMTLNQIELGRHALGLPNPRRKSYRNHFVCGLSHSDYAEWIKMVSQGDAVAYPPSALTGGDNLFRLTNVGALACLQHGERLDREDFEVTKNK